MSGSTPTINTAPNSIQYGTLLGLGEVRFVSKSPRYVELQRFFKFLAERARSGFVFRVVYDEDDFLTFCFVCFVCLFASAWRLLHSRPTRTSREVVHSLV